jgi:hypothetical protein
MYSLYTCVVRDAYPWNPATSWQRLALQVLVSRAMWINVDWYFNFRTSVIYGPEGVSCAMLTSRYTCPNTHTHTHTRLSCNPPARRLTLPYLYSAPADDMHPALQPSLSHFLSHRWYGASQCLDWIYQFNPLESKGFWWWCWRFGNRICFLLQVRLRRHLLCWVPWNDLTSIKNCVFWNFTPCGVRRLLVTPSVVPSSPILVILMKEALNSSET